MFVYIDESGHPHPNDPHTRPVDVGVCLKREDVRQITGALHRFIQDVEASMASTTRLRSSEREGKAVAFLNRRGLLKWPAKRVYADAVMDLIRNLDVTIFAMVMERPDRPIYRREDKLQTQHRWILERVDALIERKETGRMATLVFDGRDRSENVRLDKCFSNFLFRSAEGRAMTRIVPGVLFVDSEITPGIKLADFCAYILRVYYEHGMDRQDPRGDPYLATIKRYAEIIRQKTFNWEDDDGVKSWGIRTMGKEHFRYQEQQPPSRLPQKREPVAAPRI